MWVVLYQSRQLSSQPELIPEPLFFISGDHLGDKLGDELDNRLSNGLDNRLSNGLDNRRSNGINNGLSNGLSPLLRSMDPAASGVLRVVLLLAFDDRADHGVVACGGI
jgi:hypothetical protein